MGADASKTTEPGRSTAPAADAAAVRAGALAFLDMAPTMGRAELERWVEDHLVAPGFLAPTASRAGATAAPGRWIEGFSTGPGPGATIAEALVQIRATVLETLRRFVRSGDDRFLAAAIYEGRVQRVRAGRGFVWRPTPSADDALTDVVLALFAADVLAHREHYEQRLRVCDVCGVVSFWDGEGSRWGCRTHLLSAGHESGFRRSV